MAGKLKNFENEKNTVSPGIWIETLKKVENEKCTLQDLEYGKKTANHGKLETHNVGPGIWQKAVKNVKNGNTHCRTWIMSRKLKNVKNEYKHWMT